MTPQIRPGIDHGEERVRQLDAGVIDEGAGPYDSQAFRGQLEDNAIRLSFDVDRDACTCDLRTLTATRELAFDLLRLALREPRFDAERTGIVFATSLLHTAIPSAR